MRQDHLLFVNGNDSTAVSAGYTVNGIQKNSLIGAQQTQLVVCVFAAGADNFAFGIGENNRLDPFDLMQLFENRLKQATLRDRSRS